MDATSQRANGFVLPGEDPDQLVATAQSAMAVVPQLSDTIAALQAQNQQMQQMVQQSREMVTAMMLQAKDLQAQLTTGRLVPVLPQVVMHAGLLMDLPTPAMTALSMSREVTPEGAVREQLSMTFDPADVIRASGEAALQRAKGAAKVHHSRSVVSKAFGRTEED
jgi:hypothetical protein